MVLFYDEYSSEALSATVEKYLNSEFVQPRIGQMPKILERTTLTNHLEILCRYQSNEERIFYILYANKELNAYPNATIMFKDTLFVDFLNLPKKHSESKLKNGLVEHMKQFILELGKDFIFPKCFSSCFNIPEDK